MDPTDRADTLLAQLDVLLAMGRVDAARWSARRPERITTGERESAIGAARPTVGSGSVTPSFGVAPAGYQGSTTDDARWHARY